MKKLFKAITLLLTITLILPFNAQNVYGQTPEKTMTILFTHDMHDHFLPFDTRKNDEIVQLGGYPRLQSAINNEKKIDPNAILVDAGDFSMGTLFQSIFAIESPQLRIMGQMGYDVVTFGNHEYDFRANGLANSLNAAKNSGDKLPQIVQSNVSFPTDKNGEMSKSLKNLKQAMTNYGVKDYTVVDHGGVKIGIFGLTGKDSASNAPMSEVKFTDAIEKAKNIVDTLKNKEKVDLIICLSHSGTDENKSKSEDEILAKKVPEINVIISGHTHTALSNPITVDNTIIGSCGEYGENLGVIKISGTSKEGWKLDSYNLKQINNSLPEDMNISRAINKFKKDVERNYLSKFNMKFDEVLAYSPFSFNAKSDIELKHGEDPLGNLISDAYIYAVKKAEGDNYEPIAASIVPNGTIRDSFVKGNITVSDAFTVSSLGIGADNIPGYPLVSAYLTGKEIKAACEVDASISPMMKEAQLYMSNVNFKFNPNRMILNRVTNVTVQNPNGKFESIDDTKLYRVVVGLYSAQMLSAVNKKSYGILSIVPKTKDGKPITDFEAQIIKDSKDGNNIEVKEWLAIAEYLKSFDKVNGIPQIPNYYTELHGRKVVDNNHSLYAILSNPNSIALTAYAIVLVIIILVIFIIVMIATRKKRAENRKLKKMTKSN